MPATAPVIIVQKIMPLNRTASRRFRLLILPLNEYNVLSGLALCRYGWRFEPT